MAITAELDALLAAAAAQGVTLTSVVEQAQKRYNETSIGYQLAASLTYGLNDMHTASDFQLMRTSLSTNPVTTLDLAWARAVSAAVHATDPAGGVDNQGWFLLYVYEILRVLKYNNPALPSFSMKSTYLIGRASVTA